MSKKRKRKSKFTKISKTFESRDRCNPVHWFGLAYKDYIASRLLLRNSMLIQGVQLASSCIEKYFKGVLAMRNQKTNGHLSNKMLKLIKNQLPGLYDDLNHSFLKYLCKAYQTRYLDTMPIGFCIDVPARKVLAELDYTVFTIESGMKAKASGGQKVESRYQIDKANALPEVVEDNYKIMGFNKTIFLNQISKVYQMLNSSQLGLVEVEYFTPSLPNDGKFLTSKISLKSNSEISTGHQIMSSNPISQNGEVTTVELPLSPPLQTAKQTPKQQIQKSPETLPM